MKADSHIKDSTNTIHNAKIVKKISKKILSEKTVKRPEQINELNKIMQSVIVSTDKAMKDAKLAENRTKSRLIEVKKETAKTVTHTRIAKYAANASKKSASAALAIAKKMKTPELEKKYNMKYNVQIEAAVRTAKVAKKEAQKATKASKTAKIAAKMALKEM